MASLLTLLCGCIHNDLPYPRIYPEITDIMAEGESAPAVIDAEKRLVTLTMGEDADLSAVKILDCVIAPEGAVVADDVFASPLNLIRPCNVTLRLYQDIIWTIRATQPIERAFTVDGQMGASVIDVPGRRVVFNVARGADISALNVTACKLGSSIAVQTPDLTGRTVDFSSPVEVEVSERGNLSHWTIYCEVIDASVLISSVDPWTRVAWISASAHQERDNGFEYRLEGSTEWMKVPAEWITVSDGTMTCRLIHLSPSTTYEVRAYSDLDYTTVHSFTTGEEAQLPNGNMDLWWLDGKVWDPWAEGSAPFWDTGNKGASTLGTSNTIPTPETYTGTGYAAQLKSEFKGVGSIGKLAAGNIFTGVYVRTDGTNGILNFGRNFSQRPTRLTAMYKYVSAPISHVGSDPEFADWKGRPDIAQIYIALTDWSAPLEIRTNPRNRQLFDPDDPGVIAYGSLSVDETVAEWTPLSIDLEYRSTSRVPRYILVVCSASKYGDYFVGGTGSILTIDDFTLEYDY